MKTEQKMRLRLVAAVGCGQRNQTRTDRVVLYTTKVDHGVEPNCGAFLRADCGFRGGGGERCAPQKWPRSGIYLLSAQRRIPDDCLASPSVFTVSQNKA